MGEEGASGSEAGPDAARPREVRPQETRPQEAQPRDPRRDAAAAGFCGVAGATGILALVSIVFPEAPFPPLESAQAFIRAAPGDLATFAIERLGHLALPLGVVSFAAAFVAGGALLGLLILPLERRLGGRSFPAASLALVPLWIAWFIAAPPAARSAHLAGYLATAVVAVVTSGAIAGAVRRRQREEPDLTGPRDPTRRYFVRAAAAGGGGILLAASGLNRIVRPAPDPSRSTLTLASVSPVASASPAPDDAAFASIEGLTPEVTPLEDFYTIDEAFVDPTLDPATWQLAVEGVVTDPTTLSYERLIAHPALERYQTLMCISDPVGGDLISTTRWTGIRLRDLLEPTGIPSGAVEVVFRSADGYSDSLSIEQAMDESTLLAIGMDGRPLSRSHGYPTRLLSVGTYGMKNPKWITSIEVVDRPYDGYWEQRGWAKVAPIKTTSRIDVPRTAVVGRTAVIAGMAFAGDRGISKVEVSADGGREWAPATLKTPLSALSWRLWRFDWTPETPGETVLTVRAFDGQGVPQTAQEAPPHPDGASGLPTVTLEVASG